MTNLSMFIEIANEYQNILTFNTLENLYKKLENVPSEKLLTLRNLCANLKNVENIENENLRQMVHNDLKNKIEVFVNQL